MESCVFVSCAVSVLGINRGLSVSQGCQSVILHTERERVLPFKRKNTVNRNSSLIKAYFSMWRRKSKVKSPSPHLELYSTSQAVDKEYKVEPESLSLERGKRNTQVSVWDRLVCGSWINLYNAQCDDSQCLMEEHCMLSIKHLLQDNPWNFEHSRISRSQTSL